MSCTPSPTVICAHVASANRGTTGACMISILLLVMVILPAIIMCARDLNAR